MSARNRVIEYLRQFRRQTSVDTTCIHTVWTDPEAEAAPLRPDDLDTLIAESELYEEHCGKGYDDDLRALTALFADTFIIDAGNEMPEHFAQLALETLGRKP